MKCKHCGEEIFKHGRQWCHHPLVDLPSCGRVDCFISTKAEPAEEWITPTSGPTLPEVEVRNHDMCEWQPARLLFTRNHSFAYVVRIGNNSYNFAQCRMRKEIK